MIWKNLKKLWAKQALVFLVRVYQVSFRAYFATGCYFYPSCSEYAVACLEQRKLHKAIPAILWRLLRCHPLGKERRRLVVDTP